MLIISTLSLFRSFSSTDFCGWSVILCGFYKALARDIAFFSSFANLLLAITSECFTSK